MIVLTMLLLLVAFRSILVPIKAAIAILLSSVHHSVSSSPSLSGAGWPAGSASISALRCLVHPDDHVRGPLRPVDGLRVFILTRVREEYSHSGDPHHAVLKGLASSARVITAPR